MTTVSAECELKAEEGGIAGVTAVPTGTWVAPMGECVGSVESGTLKMFGNLGSWGLCAWGRVSGRQRHVQCTERRCRTPYACLRTKPLVRIRLVSRLICMSMFGLPRASCNGVV